MKRAFAGLMLLTILYFGIWLISKSLCDQQKIIRYEAQVHWSISNNYDDTISSPSCYCDSRKRRNHECEFMLNRSVLIHQPPLNVHLQSSPCLLLDEWLISKEQVKIVPVYSIILTVWNQETNINNTLSALLKYTRGAWELIIVFDQCRDKSIAFVRQMRFINANPTLLHVRLIEQETGVGETSANNIGMRASHPDTTFFVLVQDDHIMRMPGWNILLAEPARLFADVFSISARCGHTFWSYGNQSFIGRCKREINKSLSMLFQERCKFYVRDTSNRGPLLLHAARTRRLGYLDEENYWLGDDEHDLNFRAYAAHGWLTGFRPIDFDSPLELGGSRRKIHVSQTKEEDEYRDIRVRKRAQRLSAFEQFISKRWLTKDTFVILDFYSGSVNLRTFMQQRDNLRKLTESHDETRPLNECSRLTESFSSTEH